MSKPKPFTVTVPLHPAEIAAGIGPDDVATICRREADLLFRQWGRRLDGYELSSVQELSPSSPWFPLVSPGTRLFECAYLPATPHGEPDPFKVVVPLSTEIAADLTPEDIETICRSGAEEVFDDQRRWGDRLDGYEFASYRELSPSDDPWGPPFAQGVRTFEYTYLPGPINQVSA